MRVSYLFFVDYEDLDTLTHFQESIKKCISVIEKHFNLSNDDVLKILDGDNEICRALKQQLFEIIEKDDFYKQTFLKIADFYGDLSVYKKEMVKEMIEVRVTRHQSYRDNVFKEHLIDRAEYGGLTDEEQDFYRKHIYGNRQPEDINSKSWSSGEMIRQILILLDETLLDEDDDIRDDGLMPVDISDFLAFAGAYISSELIWICNKADTLHLYENCYMQPDIEGFELCEDLVDLELQIENDEIPVNVFECRNVTNFKVKAPNVKEISDNIGQLTELRRLSLKDSKSLVRFPNVLGDFPKLQFLDFSFCGKLVEVPDSIGFCVYLTTLYLKFCYSLTSLPSSIGNLENLQTVDVSINPKKFEDGKNFYENILIKDDAKLFVDYFKQKQRPLIKSARKR